MSNLRDENGSLKYNNLWALAKCIMLLSHGNADPERGFSINKHLLSIHGHSIGEDTIQAIRLTKDYIIKCGGLEKVPITKKLLRSCKEARSKYEKDLNEKQQLALKEAEAVKAKKEAATENKKISKKQEELEKMNRDISSLNTGILIADKSVVEGNAELSNCLQSKSLNREKIQQAQSKIEMGVKRKLELVKAIEIVKAKKERLQEI